MTNFLLTAALALFQQAAPTAQKAEALAMTSGGWVFMIAAWAFILTLVYYTFSKVLRGGGHK